MEWLMIAFPVYVLVGEIGSYWLHYIVEEELDSWNAKAFHAILVATGPGALVMALLAMIDKKTTGFVG